MRSVITTLLLLTVITMSAQNERSFMLRPVGEFNEASAKVLFDEIRDMTEINAVCRYTPKSKEISVASKNEVNVIELLRELERNGWFIALGAPLSDDLSSQQDFSLRAVRDRWVEGPPRIAFNRCTSNGDVAERLRHHAFSSS